MKERKKSRKLSNISKLHYFKLVFRSLLLVAALVVYIVGRVQGADEPFFGFEETWYALPIWLVIVVEIILRFFPSKLESMGCQKQFKRNYQPTGETKPQVQSWKVTALVTVLWLALNAVIGALYLFGLIDWGILFLVSLVFSVCDMICILFFCPFQTWFMKNKCCGSCRIYNWDYAMMFTPLVFVPKLFTWSILFFALALLVRWEIAFRLHPERFAENTNRCLSCANCPEKLCHHKRQLRSFLRKNARAAQLKGNAILEKLTSGDTVGRENE